MVVDQIVLVGQALSGRALDWFDRETTYPRRSVLDWSLEDLLCGLYERFINVANVNEPTKKYESLRYSQAGGVKQFADDMQYWAEHMMNTPSAYDVNKKFLQSIPVDMTKHLLLNRRMSAESTSFMHLVDAAMEYETREIFVKDYLGAPTSATRQRRTPQPRQNANQPAARPKFTPRTREHQRDYAPARPFDQMRRFGARRPQFNTNARRSNPPYKAPRAEPRVEHGNRQQSTRPQQRRQEDYRKNVTCFACGQKGHYATDPTCPKYKSGDRRPALRMAHVVEQEDNDTLPSIEQDMLDTETSSAEKAPTELSPDDAVEGNEVADDIGEE